MDEVGLIHMNGRVYDPRLGRFLEADPTVQAPDDTQSYNRYAYVRNNPLSYTDPTGFSWWTNFRDRILRPVLSIAAAIVFAPGGALAFGNGLGAALGAGFVSGAIATGNLRGAAIGAFGAGLFYGIGSHFSRVLADNQRAAAQFAKGLGADDQLAASYASSVGLTTEQSAAKILEHGLAGGVISELSGGKFGNGFFSAGLTEGFGLAGFERGSRVVATFKSLMLGGTVSAMTGGKFANGALTGAFSSLFNELSHPDSREIKWVDGKLYQPLRVRGCSFEECWLNGETYDESDPETIAWRHAQDWVDFRNITMMLGAVGTGVDIAFVRASAVVTHSLWALSSKHPATELGGITIGEAASQMAEMVGAPLPFAATIGFMANEATKQGLEGHE